MRILTWVGVVCVAVGAGFLYASFVIARKKMSANMARVREGKILKNQENGQMQAETNEREVTINNP